MSTAAAYGLVIVTLGVALSVGVQYRVFSRREEAKYGEHLMIALLLIGIGTILQIIDLAS